MELDPEVTKRTLGAPYKNLTPDVFLQLTKKLVALNKGEVEPDDRDHMAYQVTFGPEDLFAERMKFAHRALRPMLWKASFRKNLGGFQPGFLTKQLQAALLTSGLGQPLEEVNPVDIYDQMTRVTRMGEGGISADAIPMESRNVLPSHFGFIDPIRTPESNSIGVDLRFGHKTRKGNDGRLYTPFLDVRSGKLVPKSPQDLADAVISFPGEMNRDSKFVAALDRGRVSYVPKEKVDYALPEMEHAFNALANMTPMKSASKANRSAMASRILTQALPLKDAEAPLVQSGIPDQEDRSYEEEYGRHMGSVHAKGDGVVESVRPDSVTVKYADGTRQTHELYNNFPTNRKTFLHGTPVVSPGDRVGADTLLAKSNFTDAKGTTALGLNLRTAYLAYKGSNFEDAYTISESAAKKLNSEHMYQHDAEWDDKVRRGRRAFVSLFPTKFDRRQMDILDDDGIVKPGTEIQSGDPLVLMAKEKDRAHNQVSRGKDSSFSDQSLTWDHHAPGVVTDVAKTKKGVVVTVKSYNTMNVGDKLTGRSGDKGVIGCYDDQTEVLTRGGWRKFADLAGDEMVAVWNGDNASFAKPIRRFEYQYDGELLGCRHDRLDYLVTPNHRMWARIEHYRGVLAEYGFRTAEEAHDKSLYYTAAVEFETPPTPAEVKIERGPVTTGRRAKCEFPSVAFYSMIGWYLAEGSPAYYESDSVGETETKVTSYKVQISQSRTANPEKCKLIEQALTELGVGWHYSGCQYTFSHKPLYLMLSALGKAPQKRIPRELITSGSRECLQAMLGAMSLGDGSRLGIQSRDIKTTSRGMADDAQEVAAILGFQAVVRKSREAQGTHSAQWTVTISDRTEVGTGREGSFYAVAYSGKVYCLEVPGGRLLVRRNGKPFWCGNSIVPDDQMPRDSQGRPFEVLANPLGIVTRSNPNQLVEAALGKIAAVTGRPYKVKDFGNITDLAEFAAKELAKHGMSDTEDVVDPVSGRKIPGVFTGNRYWLKLHHQAESKGQGRGTGGYTQDEAPSKGGAGGSKRVSLADVNALLAHGAHGVVRDASAIRGQKNLDYWSAFMQGKAPGEPRVPFVYRKFLDQLRSAGINPVRRGSKTQFMALTNKDVDELAGERNLTSADTVDWKEGLKPIKGGLFDPTLTGGHGSSKWAAIPLHEPMVNPVMADPARRVLGLTEKKFEDVLAGKESLGAETGPAAIKNALSRIDVDKEIARARQDIASGKKTLRDSAVRKLAYLKAAKATGVHPGDWVLNRAPVLPPAFRPVSVMQGNGRPMVADANLLYKDLIEANNNLRDMSGKVDDLSEERLAVYRALKAVTGLGDPVSVKNQERQVKGALRYVFGSGPKFSTLQRKLLGSSTDLVGRAVITPNPDLTMDETGIPESKAWEVYKPFIVRRLVKRGVDPVQAANLVKEQKPIAKQALLDEMDERPVILNRAPVLHRYGVMAFRPRLVRGETLQVSPMVVSQFAGDFDGDMMNYSLPSSEDAVRDALEKMLPSKNLFSAATMRSHFWPKNEYVGGLYAATRPDEKKPEQVFRTKADMVRALQQGRIREDTRVVIMEPEK